MLDEDAGADEVCGGKSDNPHWDRPKTWRTDVRFVLYQSQVWVNRQSLLQWLENEIARIKENHIPGINNYWDHSKVEYLRHCQKLLRGFQPGGSDEIVG